MFQGKAHGMPHTTFAKSINCQMVLPVVHSIDLGIYFYGLIVRSNFNSLPMHVAHLVKVLGQLQLSE
jgi:hypothetical protein